MGNHGPLPKDPARRQRRNKPDRPDLHLSGTEDAPVELPTLPAGVLSITRERWDRFWAGPLARLLGCDVMEIERLFLIYDERERAYRRFQRKRHVQGSGGQPVLAPSWKVMVDCDRTIDRMVDKLGMTAASRRRLGIVIEAPGGERGEVDELNSIEPDDTDPR